MIAYKEHAITNVRDDVFFSTNKFGEGNFDISKIYKRIHNNIDNEWAPEWHGGTYPTFGYYILDAGSITLTVNEHVNDGYNNSYVKGPGPSDGNKLMFADGIKTAADGTSRATFGEKPKNGDWKTSLVLFNGKADGTGFGTYYYQTPVVKLPMNDMALWCYRTSVVSHNDGASSTPNGSVFGYGPSNSLKSKKVKIASTRSTAIIGLSNIPENATSIAIAWVWIPATTTRSNQIPYVTFGKFRPCRKIVNDTSYDDNMTSNTTVCHPQYLGSDASGYKYFHLHNYGEPNITINTDANGNADGYIAPCIVIKGARSWAVYDSKGVPTTYNNRENFLFGPNHVVGSDSSNKYITMSVPYFATSCSYNVTT